MPKVLLVQLNKMDSAIDLLQELFEYLFDVLTLHAQRGETIDFFIFYQLTVIWVKKVLCHVVMTSLEVNVH